MDREKINVVFHNRANDALNDLFRMFKASAATINRQRDENVFQQQVAKYSNQLKHNLDVIAMDLLGQSQSDTNNEDWSRTLSHFIESYVLAFRQKAQAS